MLFFSAFNAFLKTLEEPPKHAIFILATTEKHKIIPTILSRCQIFDFKRITINDIREYLKYIAQQQGIAAEDEALQIIAQKADGAMRDALSIFDRISRHFQGQEPDDPRPEKLWLLPSRNAGRQSEWLWLCKPVYGPEKVIEFFGGSFWILFIIWLIRSFLFEPFRIPSGSMEPNLYAGDFILTSKYSYGLRLPVLGMVIVPVGTPQRGDVVVFRYPLNKKLNYIKRIVASLSNRLIFACQNGFCGRGRRHQLRLQLP